ncbi:MAG TPA: protein kinase [Planctomycetota bacterium]|nr:protein kinase [Planctomycetota bacterium]
MQDVDVGGILHGHKLLEKVGRGHYGEVWRAEYLGHEVALKIFTGDRRPAHLRREVFAQYALGRLGGQEGRWFPRVDHLDLDAEPPYLRMEFIEGVPLESLLSNPALSLDERLSIGEQVLRALATVHAHEFVHGDLSPLNVLVTPAREVRLIDVGYGALFDASVDVALSTTTEDQPAGVASPLYSAPERFKIAADGCGKPSDVFSFGKLLYHMMTGEQPFVIKPVSLKFRALGQTWDDFVFKCLEEKPEARFADAASALAEYRRIFRPALAPGEYRAECPECRSAQSIPGGWAGERYDCRGCGRRLEVLFYDDASRYATTALLGAGEEASTADVEILDVRTAGQSRKFCPSCGGEMKIEAKKCRHCGAWADEKAKELMAAAREAAARPAEIPSFLMASVVAFLAYFFFWVPGLILNLYFLDAARTVRRETGREPAGLGALRALLILFVYVPLAGVGALAMLVLIGSLLARGLS